jgi:microcystin-dependent protein
MDHELSVKGDASFRRDIHVHDETLLSGATIIESSLTVAGVIEGTDTTQSTSPTTGSVILAGGVGIAKDLQVGGNIYQSGYLLVPTGCVLPYSGAGSPSGYLLCDGSSVTDTAYPALFAVIGNTYGGVSPNFLLPDLRTRVPVGANASVTDYVLGDISGNASVTLAENQLAPHVHTVPIAPPTSTTTEVQSGSGATVVSSVTAGIPVVTDTSSVPATQVAVSLMNPYIALNYIIKY